MLTPPASCTLYLQTGPGAYTRVYVPACFWQEGEDGANIIIPGELPKRSMWQVILTIVRVQPTDMQQPSAAAKCRQHLR